MQLHKSQSPAFLYPTHQGEPLVFRAAYAPAPSPSIPCKPATAQVTSCPSLKAKGGFSNASPLPQMDP